jgi:hypothetical protein
MLTINKNERLVLEQGRAFTENRRTGRVIYSLEHFGGFDFLLQDWFLPADTRQKLTINGPVKIKISVPAKIITVEV